MVKVDPTRNSIHFRGINAVVLEGAKRGKSTEVDGTEQDESMNALAQLAVDLAAKVDVKSIADPRLIDKIGEVVDAYIVSLRTGSLGTKLDSKAIEGLGTLIVDKLRERFMQGEK